MEDSLKVILDKHWNTLVRYINPTPSLINILVTDKVLPAAMIDDVQGMVFSLLFLEKAKVAGRVKTSELVNRRFIITLM
ncbi:hypothetical protein PoB_002095400 [Plakobranchus ocellatus]|uniref:Uncharacterized protein n=1 Tax=Plakobranchus ocellatus TaxID=259542 RepID=A0AAV3ZKQ5_9GAST|nr:hypothetical protein PoB_002095400 [Plakobranchus ocellatus]